MAIDVTFGPHLEVALAATAAAAIDLARAPIDVVLYSPVAATIDAIVAVDVVLAPKIPLDVKLTTILPIPPFGGP